ncbi:hypothetical protein JKG68_10730 [Microvirga aerilata]|uniref:DUF2357 domain-containing protein n=1 Tax=Microvirga aerilata TaxID=670292 RepID=A0A937CWX7_9HYPH|nr:nuclease domain-containing protein [Microvirga aerilata]MBL0404443.1 hypothetical protein [Microvirga aerilata]
MQLLVRRLTPGPEVSIIPIVDRKVRVEEGWRLLIVAETRSRATARLSGVVIDHRQRDTVEGGYIQQWEIEIFVWAGCSVFSVSEESGEEHRLTLDVAPHEEKFGAARFREMLHELAETNKDLLWGLSPGAVAATRGSDSPPIVHPTIIEADLPAVLDAIRQLRADPLLLQERRREVLPLSRNRRPDHRTLKWMLSRGQSQIALKSISDNSDLPDPRLVVDQSTVFVTSNHPATRYIKSLLGRLQRSLRLTARAFESVARGSGEGHLADNETRARAAYLGSVVTRAVAEIQTTLRGSLFKDLEPLPLTETTLQAIGGHPLYGRIQTMVRRLLEPGLDLADRDVPSEGLMGALRPTFDLFELLVLSRLQRALTQTLGAQWQIDERPFTPGALLSHDGSSTRQWIAHSKSDRTRVELTYQPEFGAYAESKTELGRRSLSGKRRPDFTLSVWDKQTLVAWTIIDAKYRASRQSIHDALADIHIYRDSLRWHGRRCDSAFIVVPALAPDAIRYSHTDYLLEHNFGALVLDRKPAEPINGQCSLQPALRSCVAALRS